MRRARSAGRRRRRAWARGGTSRSRGPPRGTESLCAVPAVQARRFFCCTPIDLFPSPSYKSLCPLPLLVVLVVHTDSRPPSVQSVRFYTPTRPHASPLASPQVCDGEKCLFSQCLSGPPFLHKQTAFRIVPSVEPSMPRSQPCKRGGRQRPKSGRSDVER